MLYPGEVELCPWCCAVTPRQNASMLESAGMLALGSAFSKNYILDWILAAEAAGGKIAAHFYTLYQAMQVV